MKKIFITAIIVIFGLPPSLSLARNVDGTLSLIKLPNEGVPVVVAKGQDFKVLTENKGELFLVDGDGKKFPLQPLWKSLSSGKWEAKVWLSEAYPPGAYSIQLIGDNGEVDTNFRSVWIFEGFYEYYTFAHISDVHIISMDSSNDNTATFEKVINRVNSSDAQFVLITGDITHNGSIEEMKAFLKLLNKFVKPTFVCAGNHDRSSNNYELFFYTSTYAFRFSKDGYIVFDSREYRVADPWDEQDNVVYRYRRELKPSRWVFGVTHRYEYTMGMRLQLALFVDDPVDYLLYGHIHRENTKEESVLPWGKTTVFVVPACKDGYFRVYDVGEGGVFPRELTSVK
ncbi:MAG: metallophosphoesterase [Candidatus Hydrogenedentes bacterium]|nr:metallophosphoesterase [Candidatus Hydrogenedentota bacterium]